MKRYFSGIIRDMKRQQSDILENARICCLSEIYNSLPMWQQYADNHRGAVIGLRTFAENKSAAGKAEKVIYSESIPAIAVFNQHINTETCSVNKNSLLNNITSSKTESSGKSLSVSEMLKSDPSEKMQHIFQLSLADKANKIPVFRKIILTKSISFAAEKEYRITVKKSCSNLYESRKSHPKK